MFAHLVSVDIAKQPVLGPVCTLTSNPSYLFYFVTSTLSLGTSVLVDSLGFCGAKVVSMLLFAYQLHGHPLLKELCKSSAHLKYVLVNPVDLKFIL